jgi:hypothetical protein
LVKRTVTAAAIGTLLLLTTACGGEDASAGPRPEGAASSATPSETPTPTPTPSEKPTPEAPPLSRFEDRAPVKAARDWSAAMARAINAKQRGLGKAIPYMTREGQRRISGYASEDYGRYFPGPNPFTPVGVQVHGKTARIPLCWQAQGWAQNRKTKMPATRREIHPALMLLRKEGGQWKVDDLVSRSGSCDQVPVKGRGW